MAVIFVMSTDVGSGAHSSMIITPLVLWVNPDATPEQFELVHHLFRKAGHLSEYAVLGFLILRALRSSQKPGSPLPAPALLAMALVIATAYAATDEFHQLFVPGRGPALTDVLIDSCGAAAGLAVSVVTGVFGTSFGD